MTPGKGLRVLMTADAVGGVWVFASTLAKSLAARGCEVSIVTLGPPPRDHQLHALHGVGGLTVTAADAPLEWMDPAGREMEAGRAALRRAASDFRPDVVHLNGFREALYDWRAPVLVTAHSCVNSWWRACRSDDPPSDQWSFYTRAVAEGLTAADRWCAPTATMRDWMEEIYDPPRGGQVILNGIEPFHHASASREPVVLAAGRLWDEAKNIATLDAAAAELPWRVQVAGPVDSFGRSYPRQSDTNVELLGDLAHGELLARMARAEIFTVPALYEPFGLTALEAASAGCALVLSDIPTLRELWDGAALFFHPRDSGALRDLLKSLISNPELRGAVQHACHQRAKSYRLSHTTDSYLTVYRSMLHGAGSRRSLQSPPMEAVQ